MGKLDDVIHVTVDAEWDENLKTRCSTSGGVLAIGPCFTVRHWSVTQARSRRLRRVALKRCTETPAGTPDCTTVQKLKSGRTAAAPKPLCSGLDQGAERNTLEVQTMWVQQLNQIGLISLNKLNTIKNVADLLTKLKSYNSFSNINQNYWDQKLATVERLPVFDDRENESLDDDVHSIVDTTSHLTTAVFEAV